MTINEFVKKMEKIKNMSQSQIEATINKELKIKKYIGIKQKKNLIDDIINTCIFYEDNILKINQIDKYVAFTIKTISAYTGLEYSKDMEQDYDLLCENKLLKYLISQFQDEYKDVQVLLKMQCDYILSGNNIESQASKMMSKISNAVDELSSVLVEKVSTFDIHNMQIEPEDLNKLKKFINLNS